ncbi:hypothetical protein B0A49_01698 [Cryomyces minteri]|uniref:BZIP domain-containing protein n=1 Tax=Cryomyces minteri TaxID=331657 RepID=A0A4U0XRU8_9PEZI|nr:hypothetical protein B0A49_01698 [Cryomyces minteri]
MSDQDTTKSNLARIRDNQRRSRARRKEYLQELENKYRHCEAVGVEASAEIQAAARRVLEENRRLWGLLRIKGVGENEIEMAVAANDGTFAIGQGGNPQFPSAATVLNDLIGVRRPCVANSSESGRSTTGNSNIKSNTLGERRRQASNPPNASNSNAALRMPKPQPIAIPHHHQQQQGAGSTPVFSSASPHSTLSSAVPTPTSAHYPMHPQTPTAYHVQHLQQQQQRHQHPSQHQHPHMDYQYSLSYPPMGWQQSEEVFHGENMGVTCQDQNTSSCVVAANIIRGMKSDAGQEVEAELGCTEDGRDCKVDNGLVFDMMDRYSRQSMGM